MTNIRQRAPISAGTSARGTTAPPNTNNANAPAAGITGYDAIRQQHERQTVEDQRRQQERADGYAPFRFFLPSPEKQGVTREQLEANIVVLDDAPTFAMFEHSFPDPKTGRWGKGAFTVPCLSGDSHCPACDADSKDPYFALFLSIIDMTPYTNKNGQLVPFTKKLLVVKNKNQGWWFRQYERRGTLRGMQVLMVRDSAQGANHGNPEFIELHDEQAIIDSFSHPEVKSQDGQRVIKQANEDCFAYDYGRIFKKPTYEELAERFGTGPVAGSRSDADSTWGPDAGQFRTSTGIGRAGGISSRASTTIGRTPASNQTSGDADHDYDDDSPPFDTDLQQDAEHLQGQGGIRPRPSNDPSIGTGGRPNTDPGDIPL